MFLESLTRSEHGESIYQSINIRQQQLQVRMSRSVNTSHINQCWLNVGPASRTLGPASNQHWFNGSCSLTLPLDTPGKILISISYLLIHFYMYAIMI